ncbi:glycosyltransferase family 2 protein [Nocardioides houyundeii]|uniref:glycosyltransferase family 2 protein n=1 Tax=Nocardioides houyundeii TaxID=2045452 RepID=UPI001F53834C|nr:glycosyltransferase family 2 protein [Nocardioides houyundeii]
MTWPFSRRSRGAGRTPSTARVGVVIPAYAVAQWLPACLDSLLAQTHTAWQAVVVDDGSPDRSGEVARAYAARDPRIRVLRTENAGLGAARNTGTDAVEGDYLAYLDSDDVLPVTALADLVGRLEESGSDFACGSVLRWEAEPPAGRGLHEPGWMHRLHQPARTGIRIEDHPEILGDVFAWNKLYRRSFWDGQHLSWPQGLRYEDQPTTTRAYLAGRFDVLSTPVYHWRIRADGSSITQQRSSMEDLQDRLVTKRLALNSVRTHGDPEVTRVFLDRVLPGDLWRYFEVLPGAEAEWTARLRRGVAELWGDRSLVHSALPPVHRLCGWLLEQGRVAEASALMAYLATLGGAPVPRTADGSALAVPPHVLDTATVAPEALTLRPGERRPSSTISHQEDR